MAASQGVAPSSISGPEKNVNFVNTLETLPNATMQGKNSDLTNTLETLPNATMQGKNSNLTNKVLSPWPAW